MNLPARSHLNDITCMHAMDGMLYIFREGQGLQRIQGPRYHSIASRHNYPENEALITLEGVGRLDHFMFIRDNLVGISNAAIVLLELGRTTAYLQKTHALQKYTRVKHIAFDPHLRSLYVVDETAGVLKADMTFASQPREVSVFMPAIFDELKGRITGLKFFGSHLLAIIANEGVYAVNCTGDTGELKIYKTKDPRDALYIPEEGVLLIADACEGLLTFAEGDATPFQQIPMPATGPVDLEIVRFSSHVAIVRINDGLYLYHFVHQQLDRKEQHCKLFTVDPTGGVIYSLYFEELTARSCFGQPAFFGLPERGTYDPNDWRVRLYWADDIRQWKSDDYFHYGDDHD